VLTDHPCLVVALLMQPGTCCGVLIVGTCVGTHGTHLVEPTGMPEACARQTKVRIVLCQENLLLPC
jgi:hypothetical protein